MTSIDTLPNSLSQLQIYEPLDAPPCSLPLTSDTRAHHDLMRETGISFSELQALITTVCLITGELENTQLVQTLHGVELVIDQTRLQVALDETARTMSTLDPCLFSTKAFGLWINHHLLPTQNTNHLKPHFQIPLVTGPVECLVAMAYRHDSNYLDIPLFVCTTIEQASPALRKLYLRGLWSQYPKLAQQLKTIFHLNTRWITERLLSDPGPSFNDLAIELLLRSNDERFIERWTCHLLQDGMKRSLGITLIVRLNPEQRSQIVREMVLIDPLTSLGLFPYLSRDDCDLVLEEITHRQQFDVMLRYILRQSHCWNWNIAYFLWDVWQQSGTQVVYRTLEWEKDKFSPVQVFAIELIGHTCCNLPPPDRIVSLQDGELLLPEFDHNWQEFTANFARGRRLTFFLQQYIDTAQAILNCYIKNTPALQITKSMSSHFSSTIKKAYPNLMVMAFLLAFKACDDKSFWNKDLLGVLGHITTVSTGYRLDDTQKLQMIRKWERLLLKGIDFTIPKLTTLHCLQRMSSHVAEPDKLLTLDTGTFIILNNEGNEFTLFVVCDIDRNKKVKSIPFEVTDTSQIKYSVDDSGEQIQICDDIVSFFDKHQATKYRRFRLE